MGPDELTTEIWGFLENPFATFDAEIERQISKIDPELYFLMPPYFDQIVGNPIKPTSTVVFGFRGDGKSILCDRMRQKLEHHTVKVLLVDYKKFSRNDDPLDPNILNGISLEYHIDKIMDLCVGEFTKDLLRDGPAFSKLDSKKRSKLEWFVDRYHYETAFNEILNKEQNDREFEIRKNFGYAKETLEVIIKRPYNKLIRSTRHTISLLPFLNPNKDLERLSSFELLIQLRDLIRAAGFISIYIIIDKLDEDGLINFDHEQMSKFIGPLLTSLGYMQLENVATKLFIPIQIKNFLGTKFRSDRLANTIILEWSNDRLALMLKKRLLAFSQNRIDSFKNFLEPGLLTYFEDNLLYYSANNPRNLIRLIFEIISVHCNTDFPEKPIIKETIINAIKKFRYIRADEADSDMYLDRLENNLEQFKYRYIFNWNKIQENDCNDLKDLLERKYNIEWVNNPIIQKLEDDKYIKITFSEKDTVSLRLNEGNSEVILKINDTIEEKFMAKIKDQELNIYEIRELYIPYQFL